MRKLSCAPSRCSVGPRRRNQNGLVQSGRRALLHVLIGVARLGSAVEGEGAQVGGAGASRRAGCS
eukprot:6436523-Prymnesium_polylepis.1